MRIMLGLLAVLLVTGSAAATTIVDVGASGHRHAVRANATPAPLDPAPRSESATGVSLVPEAATWTMVVAGFGFIGAVTRRRLGRGVRSVTA